MSSVVAWQLQHPPLSLWHHTVSRTVCVGLSKWVYDSLVSAKRFPESRFHVDVLEDETMEAARNNIALLKGAYDLSEPDTVEEYVSEIVDVLQLRLLERAHQPDWASLTSEEKGDISRSIKRCVESEYGDIKAKEAVNEGSS